MDADRITCCIQCKQPLIEIDNRGERLKVLLDVQPLVDSR